MVNFDPIGNSDAALILQPITPSPMASYPYQLNSLNPTPNGTGDYQFILAMPIARFTDVAPEYEEIGFLRRIHGRLLLQRSIYRGCGRGGGPGPGDSGNGAG